MTQSSGRDNGVLETIGANPTLLRLTFAHERLQRQIDRVYGVEETRQARVATLKAQDESERLRDVQAQDERRIRKLQEILGESENRRGAGLRDFQSTRNELRLAQRRLEATQAELEAMQNISSESSKILNEKLTLAREVAALKLELEHSRAHANTQQGLFADKLSLQHQLDAARVEMELERRATQRALSKHEDMHAQDARLKAQLEELKSNLAQEKQDRVKAEREAQNATSDLEHKMSLFETRQSALRSKLRAAQDQVKALSDKQQRPSDLSDRRTLDADPAPLRNKRGAAQAAEQDDALGSPGDLRLTKKPRHTSTTVGGKSAFSVTPFLNRSSAPAADLREGSPTVSAVQRSANNSPEQMHAPTQAPKNIANTKPREAGQAEPPALRKPALAEKEGEPRKAVPNVKKRKVLGGVPGRTIFDDGDAEQLTQGAAFIHPSRGTALLGRSRPEVAPVRLRPAGKGLAMNAFSPLKKDKRATAA